MAWQRAIRLDAVPVGTAVAVRLGFDDLLVCRPSAAVVQVVSDLCSHEEAALGGQELADGTVRCPQHGALFDIATGAALRGPAVVGIAVYGSRVADGWVEVELEA